MSFVTGVLKGIILYGALVALIFLFAQNIMQSHSVLNLLGVLSPPFSPVSVTSTPNELFVPLTSAGMLSHTIPFYEGNPVVFSEFVAIGENATSTVQVVSEVPIVSSTIAITSSTEVSVSSTLPIAVLSLVEDSVITPETQISPTGVVIPSNIKIEPALCMTTSSNPSRVVRINELAWMGTTGSFTDEWIELYNTSSSSLSLAGAQLIASSSKSLFSVWFGVNDVISANGYFLLERTNDTSVPNVMADKIYRGALNDDEEVVELFDAGCNSFDRVDFKNDFPIISTNVDRRSMELKRDGTFALYGGDVDGVSSVFGSPRRENSLPIQASSTATSIDVLNLSTSTSTFAVASSTMASVNEIIDTIVSSTSSSTNDVEIASSTIDIQSSGSSDGVVSSTVAVSLLPLPYFNIVISEILFDGEGSDKGKEFIELYNPSNIAQDLRGWSLRLLKAGATSTTPLAVFGDNSSDIVFIPQHGFLLVGLNSYDAVNFNTIIADIRRSSVLPNGEDEVSVVLLDASKAEVDRVTYFGQSIQKEGESLERNTQGIFEMQDNPIPQFSQISI